MMRETTTSIPEIHLRTRTRCAVAEQLRKQSAHKILAHVLGVIKELRQGGFGYGSELDCLL